MIFKDFTGETDCKIPLNASLREANLFKLIIMFCRFKQCTRHEK